MKEKRLLGQKSKNPGAAESGLWETALPKRRVKNIIITIIIIIFLRKIVFFQKLALFGISTAGRVDTTGGMLREDP